MKYQELANIIRKEMEDGVYKEALKLPTENVLMEKYKVSRYCVRNAVNILTKLGHVYPVQGSGIFIRKSRREGCLSLGSAKGLTEELADHAVTTDVERLELIHAEQELAERMKCEIGTPVYFIIRTRIVDGVPLAVEYTYYNQDIIKKVDEKTASGSMFRYIKTELGLNISFADRILYCDKLPEKVAQYLAREVGEPAIIVEDDVYLVNGQMFNASKVYYNYKAAKFFNLAEIKE